MITESTRFCTAHKTSRLIIFNGIVCCEQCDPVDEWRTHRPVVALVEPEKTGPVEKLLVWSGLILASLCVLVLVGQGVAWAWRAVFS